MNTVVHGLQTLLWVVLLHWSLSAAAGCIPTTVNGVVSPVIAGTGNLQIDGGGTLNGAAITYTGTSSLPITGTTSSATNVSNLPALSPAAFPAVGTNSVNTNGPVAAGSYGTLTVSGNPTVFSGGNYYINTLNANGPIQLASGNYYINNFYLSANLTVTGPVQIYVGTLFKVMSTGVSLNAGGSAANLQISLYSGAKFDGDKSNISFTGLMYSPFANTEVKFDNNAIVTGAIVTAGKVDLNNSVAINYNSTVQAQIASVACPVTGPDHFEISHASGTGVTCTPSTLTIKACANAACSSLYTSGVSGTLSATGTPTVNWSGGSTFSIAAGASSVTKDVQVTTAGTVVLGATASPAPPGATLCNFGSPSCTFTVASSALLLSVPHHSAETVSTLTIQAVKAVAGNPLQCAPGMTGTKSVKLACLYVNPGTGTLPVRVANTALNAAGNAAAACDAAGRNVTLTFDATGVATPTLQYADVGNMQLNASYSGTAGTLEAGLSLSGSTTFIVAPAKFSVSGSSPTPIKAGNPFSSLVTAQTTTGAATPNFGKETTPASITLTHALTSPVGTPSAYVSAGALAAPIYSAWSVGVSTATTSWSEVGQITLSASTSNYLGSGLSASGTSGNIGPFIPDHFDTEVTPGCASCGFTYSSQPFGVTVRARNGLAAPSTTQNYDGTTASSPNYAKAVTLTAWDAAAGTTQNPAGSLLTAAATAVPLSAFKQGVATLNTSATMPYYALGTSTTAPTAIRVRAAETTATPAVSSQGFSEGSTEVRSGRIFLPNVYGSERLALPLKATVQYYDGSRWVTSSTDSSTAFDTNLSTAGGNLVVTIKNGLASGISVTSPGLLNVTAGQRSIVLNAGNQAQGSAWIGLNAPTFLPTAPGLASFGIYKSPLIYRRENY